MGYVNTQELKSRVEKSRVETTDKSVVETGVDYIVYMYYLFKDKYSLRDWQNLDSNVYRKIQKIFLRKEVDDFRVQELAILELDIPRRTIDEESVVPLTSLTVNVLGYFGEENFRFQLENHGKN